ncbi:family 20 glycosylhydrolase [Sphingomonas sp. Tas61C01]|uniref:family 20 glycosylhydrolase n=1 Tax=Sphingomonas sp. Tas61C01 TaxID=3458297 RepID=UPI00403E8096
MLLLAAPSGAAEPAQAALDQLAETLGYRFTVVSNKPECPATILNCFLATITITTPAAIAQPFPTKDFGIYFSFVSRLPLVESDLFDHQLINGDLQRLTLKPGKALKPNHVYVVKLWGLGTHFSKSHPMPNAYLAAAAVQARTIASTRPVIDRDTLLETLPFVAPMTDEAALATQNKADKTRWLTGERAFALQADRQAPAANGVVIVPKVRRAVQAAGARANLAAGVSLRLAGITRAAVAPALAGLGVGEKGSLPLLINVGRAAGLLPEGYTLDVAASGIRIRAADAAGANHALRSLAQQASFDAFRIRPLHVEDSPQYGFRGLHIDIARNFHSRAELMKLVEAMAAYKLNKLHLHLADDEGWRIEIPALPELARIGSKRCHDPAERTCLLPQLGAGPDGTSGVNGYLSRLDYIAIVRAAAARQIEVIPSIDTPGHSRAAIVAMENRFRRLTAAGNPAAAQRYRLIDPADTTAYRSIQNYDDNTLNVCIPATYRFVETVVDALAAMHRAAGAPLRTFHLGADETAGAWVGSPACAAMIAANGGDARKLTPRFIERVAAGLAAKGIRTAGWSDGMGHTDPAAMPKATQSNIWGLLHTGGVREAHDQMNRGWDVVLSLPTFAYLDMPYAPHPDEFGYDWGTREADTYRIFGVMPDNLPANTALIANVYAEGAAVDDEPVLGTGHRIAGLQGQLWSETIRTDTQVDYMLFPRLLALAERAWSPAPWSPPYQPGARYDWQDKRVDRAALASAWRDFAGRLSAQLSRLDRAGIAYRVAPPGGRIADGKLEANAELPGTTIEYRVGAEPWTRYAQPVAVSGAVDLRSRSADGKRASRLVRIDPTRGAAD